MPEPILTTATLLSNAFWAFYGEQAGKLTDKSAQFIVNALKGQESFPVNHDLLGALNKCWARSLSHFCDCFDSQVGDLAERLYLNDLRTLSQEIEKQPPSADLGGFDEQKFSDYFAQQSAEFHAQNNIEAIAFIELRLRAMPDRIRSALMHGIAPNCPDWSSCFGLLLAEEIKTSPRVFQIFTANSLATIDHRTAEIAASSSRIETGVSEAAVQLDLIAQASQAIGHDIQWIVGKLSKLSSINDRELVEVATFFGIFDAETPSEARLAIEQKAQELGVLKEKVVQQEAAERELSQIAFRDHLTGIPNRAHFHQKMAQTGAGHLDNPLTRLLVFVDLDSFYSVNNRYGHDVGDLVLIEVARRLKTVADSYGVLLCRYGGDEFLFGFHGSADQVDGLKNLAHDAREALREPIEASDAVIHVTASAGIAIDDHRLTMDLSIKGADLALYRAKDEGKDCEVLYVPRLHAEAEERRLLERDLRGAVERNELFLLYQPIVETASMVLVGFEALLRWRHPAAGPISPARFIPLAEEARLMSPIGEWALLRACEDARRWPEHVRLSINVSVEQLTVDFVEKVIEALSINAIAPHRLEIEITESAFLQQGTNAIQALERLTALGIRLTLDDFGTGYSSLGYFRSTKFSSVKVDGSFIRGCGRGETADLAIIRATIAIAEVIGLDVIAEGVETEADHEFCKAQGFTHFQGYWLGKACTAEDIAEMLNEQSG